MYVVLPTKFARARIIANFGDFAAGQLIVTWLANNAPLLGSRSIVISNIAGVIAGQLFKEDYAKLRFSFEDHYEIDPDRSGHFGIWRHHGSLYAGKREGEGKDCNHERG